MQRLTNWAAASIMSLASSAAGLNSDGRSRNTQLWVNVSMGF